MDKLERFLDDMLTYYGGSFKADIVSASSPTLDEAIDEMLEAKEKLTRGAWQPLLLSIDIGLFWRA